MLLLLWVLGGRALCGLLLLKGGWEWKGFRGCLGRCYGCHCWGTFGIILREEELVRVRVSFGRIFGSTGARQRLLSFTPHTTRPIRRSEVQEQIALFKELKRICVVQTGFHFEASSSPEPFQKHPGRILPSP